MTNFPNFHKESKSRAIRVRLHARIITRLTSQDEQNPSSRKLPGAKSRALNDWREMLGWKRHGHGLSMSINDHILWQKIRNLTCTESYMLRIEKRAVSWRFQSLKCKITSEGFRSDQFHDRKPLLVESSQVEKFDETWIRFWASFNKMGLSVYRLTAWLNDPFPQSARHLWTIVSMLAVQPRPHV